MLGQLFWNCAKGGACQSSGRYFQECKMKGGLYRPRHWGAALGANSNSCNPSFITQEDFVQTDTNLTHVSLLFSFSTWSEANLNLVWLPDVKRSSEMLGLCMGLLTDCRLCTGSELTSGFCSLVPYKHPSFSKSHCSSQNVSVSQ